nr:actin-related protein 2 [Quercus suber]
MPDGRGSARCVSARLSGGLHLQLSYVRRTRSYTRPHLAEAPPASVPPSMLLRNLHRHALDLHVVEIPSSIHLPPSSGARLWLCTSSSPLIEPCSDTHHAAIETAVVANSRRAEQCSQERGPCTRAGRGVVNRGKISTAVHDLLSPRDRGMWPLLWPAMPLLIESNGVLALQAFKTPRKIVDNPACRPVLKTDSGPPIRIQGRCPSEPRACLKPETIHQLRGCSIAASPPSASVHSPFQWPRQCSTFDCGALSKASIMAETPIVLDGGTGFLKAGYAGTNFPDHQYPSIVGRPILRTEEQTQGDIQLKDIMCGDEAATARSMLQITYPVRRYST